MSGKEEKHPEGRYKVSWYEGGRKRFQDVGQEPDAALAALTRREKTLDALAVGVEVKGEAENKARQTLTSAVAQYLSDTKDTKSKKTAHAYQLALTRFQESCRKTFLDQIEHRDLNPTYIAYLKRQGLSDRTVYNRYLNVVVFLNSYGLTGLGGAKKTWPKYTEKVVAAYEKGELKSLFEASDEHDWMLFKFFLGSGCRDQEVATATWQDLNLSAKVFTVTTKPEWGSSPKDYEERQVPLPDKLLEQLKEYRKKHSTDRLIFQNSSGRPEQHFLRRLKNLALKAGLNCGHRVNKNGLRCDKHAVCENWELHKFRKTFATSHHEKGGIFGPHSAKVAQTFRAGNHYGLPRELGYGDRAGAATGQFEFCRPQLAS